jgi:alcohol dehydrogenase YqhD (iron-dependent ADH family)
MKNFTNFNLHLYTDILFGKDTEKETGRMIRKHGGKRVMVVYGMGSVRKSGLFDRVVKTLKDEGLYFVEFGGVQPNPRRSLVEKGVALAREEKIDFFLALGGGSAIDTAKAIALAVANNGEYWKFFNGVPAGKMAPVGTVHTISASGSETSRSTVLVDDIETGHKRGLNLDCCRPVFAIMNPELTYSVSAFQTGAGAADIVAHTVARYFTKDMPSSCLGDEFAEGLVRTVIKYARAAIDNPNDYEARAELMMAATFSHNDLTGIGRNGPRGGEHALEHQLSGHYDTAHGAGLAAVMPAWLQYIVNNGTQAQVARVAQFGVKVFGVSPDMADIKAAANAGLEAFRAWVRSIGMPLTLEELGIPKEDIPAMAKRTADTNNGKIIGFMGLDEKAIGDIYTKMTGVE